MEDEPGKTSHERHDDDDSRRDADKDSKDSPQIGEVLRDILAQSQAHTAHLAEIHEGGDLDACLLEKIAHISCMTVNEVHRQAKELKAVRKALDSLLEIYRAVHPEQALQVENLARLRAEMEKCCPPEDEPEEICCGKPCERGGGIRRGDGHSVKSKGFVDPVRVTEEHKPWKITDHELNENQRMPRVPQGRLVGPIVPSSATPNVLDFRSGSGPIGGSQEPVSFRTFTASGITRTLWPPDMSGAKGGDVVLMSANLWLKLSVDSGKTFTDLDFTKLFAADTTYGGWAGDQVVHYVPSIDCFVLYVQSGAGTGANLSKSVVKVAIASPDDLKKYKGGKQAWRRQWDFTSDTFGLSSWLDFPDISYGDGFVYINTNAFNRTIVKGANSDAFAGKLFFELPLKEMKAGTGFSFQYAFITDQLTYSSPTQNIGDTNYWAAHVDNVTMRIYSSKGTDADYAWRERTLGANWPTASNSGTVKPEDLEDNIVSSAPDSTDWVSEDHRILGATLVGTVLWFGWTAASGNGGAGGFNFPQAHIQIAKFDVAQDYKFIEQTQVWNSGNAFCYPCFTTNSDNEVGISLAWGGGSSAYGSHAVGILGDFVVWYGEASQLTSTYLSPTRFGDYLHVRLAQPDTRFFSAFGYAVLKDSTSSPPEKIDYFYVEFGRDTLPSPVVK
jgi:hypothetical protein